MPKNRSDLALAKFEEADKYAPNWGRLHLKWGEALFYAGKSDEAKKQFAARGRRSIFRKRTGACWRNGRLVPAERTEVLCTFGQAVSRAIDY